MEQILTVMPTNEKYILTESANLDLSKIDITEGKRESIDSIKCSADTVLRDNNLKETLGRTFGGIFGLAFLFSSITNVITDLKSKKRSPWIYPRIILDFTASGALIGYSLQNTLLGLTIGGIIGLITLGIEIATKEK